MGKLNVYIKATNKQLENEEKGLTTLLDLVSTDFQRAIDLAATDTRAALGAFRQVEQRAREVQEQLQAVRALKGRQALLEECDHEMKLVAKFSK